MSRRELWGVREVVSHAELPQLQQANSVPLSSAHLSLEVLQNVSVKVQDHAEERSETHLCLLLQRAHFLPSILHLASERVFDVIPGLLDEPVGRAKQGDEREVDGR